MKPFNRCIHGGQKVS